MYKVSIPNGKPILFRHIPGPVNKIRVKVSIPNGKPILFRLGASLDEKALSSRFQSQTGSPSSSDLMARCIMQQAVRFQSQTGSPSSTDADRTGRTASSYAQFQSQTGSPSSSDTVSSASASKSEKFQSQTGSPSSSDDSNTMRDRSFRFCFNPKREAHPLQTRQCRVGDRHHHGVSIPNGKPILFRPMPARCSPLVSRWFQSQTGSPSSSDNRSCLAAARFSCRFQSQTGSPSSSDQAGVYDTRPGHRFQSQTGSPSSSDARSKRYMPRSR